MVSSDSSKYALLIEDDEPVRNFVRYVLSTAGYEVVEATDGEEGVRRFTDRHYDLVVTDLVMPKMDGIDAIIVMKTAAPNTRVVAISGADSGRLLKIAQAHKADAVLRKPFAAEELRAVIAGEETATTGPSQDATAMPRNEPEQC